MHEEDEAPGSQRAGSQRAEIKPAESEPDLVDDGGIAIDVQKLQEVSSAQGAAAQTDADVSVARARTPHPLINERKVINYMVYHYLVDHGYLESAETLIRENRALVPDDQAPDGKEDVRQLPDDGLGIPATLINTYRESVVYQWLNPKSPPHSDSEEYDKAEQIFELSN